MGYVMYPQRDPRWSGLQLGDCPGVTIGSSGCYLCALSMGATSLGYAVDPPTLQHLIEKHGLYVNGCDMVDDVLQELARLEPGSTPWHWLGTANAAEAQTPAQWHSGAGEFAVLGLNLGDHDHFVTIAGWDGKVLTIADPWVGAVVNFDDYYQRSAIFKLSRYAAPAVTHAAPPPPIPPEQQFVNGVKQLLADLKL